MDLLNKLTQLAEQNIFPYVQFESTGSDEWCYSFIVEWIPKEFWGQKRRVPHLQRHTSFFAMGSYVGGYDTIEEAYTKCFEWIDKNILNKKQ